MHHFNFWANLLVQRVEALRKQEIKELRKSALLQSVSTTVSPSITIVAGFATFITMTLAGVELATSEAFTILSIFNAMQFSVGTLPWSLKLITEAMVRYQCKFKSILDTTAVVGWFETPPTAARVEGLCSSRGAECKIKVIKNH